MKMPSSLEKLEKLIDSWDGLSQDPNDSLVKEWLEYTYFTLDQRKHYMKKQQIKKAIAIKLLKEHLSGDELEELDKQAQEKADS